jgi:hypothetical protein
MEEGNKFIPFLGKHWSKLLLGIVAIICLAVWAERLLWSNENQNKQDFIVVHQIFERFHKGEGLAEESIEAAENILERHPELHPKYDAMLALTFFSQANERKAEKYARSLIEQVDSELPPLYQHYAKTTLLIAEKGYAQAFEEALALQEQLKGKSGYQTLDAMNTLRLLFLADTLGDTTQKNIFWKKLEKHPAYPSIQPLFHEGKLSLEDYIKRKM